MSENELANYPGLYQRGGVWYVRKKVPIDLRHLFANDQLRKSLNTSDKRSAVRLYPARMAELSGEFEAKRAELGRQDEITRALVTARLERLTTAEIDTLVWAWWELRVSVRRPEVEDEDIPEVLSVIESDIGDVLNPNPNEGDPAAHVVDQLLVRAGMSSAPRKIGVITTAAHYPRVNRSTAQYAYLCDRVRVALEIEAKLARDSLTGKRTAPADPMFNPYDGVAIRSGVMPVHKTLGDLLDAYRQERVLEYGEESTRRKFGLLFDVLEAVLGRNTPVAEIRRQHWMEVLSFLEALPPNARKRFPTLTLTQARERAVANGLSGLAPNTVGSYMQNLAAILNWADLGEWGINSNTKGLALRREAKVKRRGFTPAELKTVFNALAFYRDKQPTRFWVPALAAYTGARASEICQLRTEDIVRMGETWC